MYVHRTQNNSATDTIILMYNRITVVKDVIGILITISSLLLLIITHHFRQPQTNQLVLIQCTIIMSIKFHPTVQ